MRALRSSLPFLSVPFLSVPFVIATFVTEAAAQNPPPGWGPPPPPATTAPPPATPPAQPPPAGAAQPQPAQPQPAAWGFAVGTNTAAAPAVSTPPKPEDAWTLRAQERHEWLTLSGSTGLLRVSSAKSAPVGTLRAQLLWDYFSGSNFLCHSNAPCSNATTDKVKRYGATFGASATVASFVEAYASFRSYATESDRSKPTLFQVLGDTTLGVKLFQPAERYRTLSFGGDVQMLFFNGAGGVGLDGKSTSARARVLATADFRQPGGQGLPLLAHVNLGYRLDNSGKLVEDTEKKRGDAPITRTERYGLGINRTDSFEIGLGLEGIFRVGEAERAVRPFAEWTVDIANNRQKYACNINRVYSGDECLGNASKLNRMPSRLTLGAHANAFMDGLMFTAAVDLGTGGTSRFLEEVSPQAPWTIWWGVGFAFDTEERPPVVKIQKEEKLVQAPIPPSYAVRGLVHEAGKTEGVAGAVITFQGRDATGYVADATGRFTTSTLDPGTYTFTVKAPGYKDGVCTAQVNPAVTAPPPPVADPAAPPGMAPMAPPVAPPPPATGLTLTDIDCQLEALPKVGNLVGQVVVGEGGGGVGGAEVIVTDALGHDKTVSADASGNFRLDGVAPGAVKLRATHADYMGGRSEGTIEPRKDNRIVVSMNKRPKTANVVVGKKEIVIRQQVHFETDSAKIKLDSNLLLEEIADVLTRNPKIKLVEIQGHTDNTGAAAHNKELSDQRANAVRDRLVSLGVAAGRLTAKGYGAERPIVPNVTAGNRARNRRVALSILEQDK